MDDNSLKFIDLFAGCGGLSLGLENADFKPVLFSELNKSAADTYRKNRECKNIKFIPDVKEIKEEALENFRNIDLVCGGPPCQGYSAIGIRRSHKAEKVKMPKNRLYEEMIRIIEIVEPKIFLFENVRGILTGKWRAEGKKGEIFRTVFEDFLKKFRENYHVRWELVKSSSYGIPQNRPRLFMVGLRKSLKFCKKKEKEFAKRDSNIFEELKKNIPLETGYAVSDGFFPPKQDKKIPGPEDCIGDLVDENYDTNGFMTRKYLTDPDGRFQEEIRKKKNGSYFKKGEALTEQEYSRHNPKTKKKFQHMIDNDGEYPKNYKSEKFAQRVLKPEWKDGKPSITVTSLPDDYVHYSQPRILTVREWARLQTFPDWYKFEGPRTTGGERRSGTPMSTADQIETPKYTQIGNAVPVDLAYLIGEHFKNTILINELD